MSLELIFESDPSTMMRLVSARQRLLLLTQSFVPKPPPRHRSVP